jgi:hypothetical protein
MCGARVFRVVLPVFGSFVLRGLSVLSVVSVLKSEQP